MKKIFYIILLVSVLFSMSYCKNNDSQQSQNNTIPIATANSTNYDELAKEYCSCSEEIVALNKKMKKLHEEGRMEEMADLLSDIDMKSSKQADCQNTLEARFGTKIDTSKAVLLAIKKICPDLGEYIENAKKEIE